MSITKEQAATWLETMHPPGPAAREMYRMAAKALRPVSRDRIEKVWSGCHECSGCKLCIWNETKKCNDCKNRNSFRPLSDFCPRCGKPLTDEAVDMMMERLEALESDARGTI